MKKLIYIAVLSALCSVQAFGWSTTGHSAIGHIADNHLTPAAKEAIKKYVGFSLATIANDADKYRDVWTLDLGFVPSNPDDARLKWLKNFDFSSPLNISPWSHSITVDENFVSFKTDNFDGEYINNDAYYVERLAGQLRDHAEEMDPYERYKAIALIAHFIGDMHCPMHIVYLPKNTAKGHIKVIFKGKSTSLHNVWDSAIITDYSSSFVDIATIADTASEDEISIITEGNVYDWAGDCGRKCWSVHNEYSEGDVLPKTYPAEHRDLLFSQLRNGGYRLAAVFNEIFK